MTVRRSGIPGCLPASGVKRSRAWFVLCGLVGAWRIRHNLYYDIEGIAWKIELVCTLAAFAVASVLLTLVIYSRVAH